MITVYNGCKEYKQDMDAACVFCRTFKMNCPVHITASVDRDGEKLVVLDVNLDHNHDTNAFIAATYPENRRLDTTERRACAALLDLGVSVSRVRSLLKDSSGKPLTLRDIHNQRVVNDKAAANGLSDTQLLVAAVDDMLQNDPGSEAVYAVNDNDELRLLFWQTSEMTQVYDKFPEVLFIDGTYCVNSVRMPLYCLCVQDGYGHGRVCGYALVADETFQSVYTVLEVFRDKNKKSTSDLCTVIVDKDFTEIACVSQIFPNAKLQICSFHVLKAFRTAIGNLQTADKATKDSLRDIVQKLVYCQSEEKFQEVYTNLTSVNCGEFLDYFDRNWLHSRMQWVRGLCAQNFNLLNWTNNRVEAHNKQIKTVVKNTTKLHKLFLALLHLQTSKSVDCTYEQAVSLSKIRYQRGNSSVSDEVCGAVYDLCTPYAANLVLRQLQNANKYANSATVNVLQTEAFVNMDGNTSYAVDLENKHCNCAFNVTTGLPCKHIFVYRTVTGLTLLSADMVPMRWQKCYAISGVPALTANSRAASVMRTSSTARADVLSKVEKYRLVTNVTKQLCDIVCSVGHNEFLAKFGLLDDLVNYWSSNTNVMLTAVVEDDANVYMSASPTNSQVANGLDDNAEVVGSTHVSSSAVNVERSVTVVAEVHAQHSPCMTVEHSPHETTCSLHSAAAPSDVCSLPSELHSADCVCVNLSPERLSSDDTVTPFVSTVTPMFLSYAVPATAASLNDLKLPLRNNVRGRPKGAATTVVGKTKAKRKKENAVPVRKRRKVQSRTAPLQLASVNSRDVVIRDDICYKCNGCDPPEEVSAENVVHWTACERDCSRWFHAACINSVPSFICGWCSGGKL